jgi:hypothetical protein
MYLTPTSRAPVQGADARASTRSARASIYTFPDSANERIHFSGHCNFPEGVEKNRECWALFLVSSPAPKTMLKIEFLWHYRTVDVTVSQQDLLADARRIPALKKPKVQNVVSR